MSKYSDVYRNLGCGTLQYILPTRFIFKHCEQIHETVDDIAKYIKKKEDTPLIIHCLSDTGTLCFQGFSIASDINNLNPNIHGIVWDSCPAPKPKFKLHWILILCVVNWLTRMRDGMNVVQALYDGWDDFYHMGWRNCLRGMRGEDPLVSTMNNTWTGDWARDLECSVHELFLYSKTDFYCQYRCN